MNQSLIVKPHLDKARNELTDATYQLGLVATCDAETTMAIEALGRAIGSITVAVERLAELVVDD